MATLRTAPEFQNPDMAALTTLQQVLQDFTWVRPDGSTGRIEQIDVGYQSKPSYYPYASLHTLGSTAEIRHLGRGGGKDARLFKINGLIAIEHEAVDAKTGFEELTQLRWEVFLRLLEVRQSLPGVTFANFEEANVQTFNSDDGSFEDWGFFGQVLIPIEIELNGTDIIGPAGS